ncbi:MAG: lactate utilization protein [Candidatus Pelethousia sp.]|nr:lactate utilization protein [Candidatus Pelethousia sp.]
MFCSDYDTLVQTLQKHGFTVHTAASAEDARTIALTLVGKHSVGLGGSMTLAGLGMYEALCANGNVVFSHSVTPPAEDPYIFTKENSADWYLASSNAITRDGKLVNIDGTGNRVAGMFAGPKQVALIIGKNKLAEDVSAGYQRIKQVVAPKNAKRLNRKTPCAVDGTCHDCNALDRICRVTTVIDYKPGWVKELHLILTDAELGY